MRRSPIVLTSLVVAGILSFSAHPAEAQRRIPINIESTPPGAAVFVDSTQTPPIGTTPLRSVRVPVGRHTLIFQLANHEEGRLEANVRRRRETFRIVLNPLGTVVLSAGNTEAQSAAVRLDGQPVGNIPYRSTVQPGRHLIQVGREGHVTFTQWVEVAGGQVLTIPVMLERDVPETGSVLVAGDITGAPIYVDGDPRGVTPTLLENIPAGEHQLEIRPQGMEPYRQTIRVLAGERVNVNPTLRAGPAQAGSLRVIANVPGAVVSLDGEALGEAPVSRDAVAAGEHILEAEAQGYLPVQQPVAIESGQQRVVSLRLERDPSQAGRIVVDASVSGAVVTIDGEERGAPPVVIESPTAGAHAIVVSADGYEDYRTTCETGPGQNCEVSAELSPVGTPVRVEANARDAQLYVDGELVGPIPYEGNLPVGPHRIEVRAEGYMPHIEQVSLTASSTPRIMSIGLTAEGDLSEEDRAELAQERSRQRTGATSHAAAPLPPDLAVLDLSVGWPYLAEIRLNVGILDWVEGGFSMRTFGRLTEFEGRAKLGIRPLRQLSVAAQARFGGGLGPNRDALASEGMGAEEHATNTFFLELEAMGTLHFSDQGAFTLWMGVDFSTDRYDWSGEDSDCLASDDTCVDRMSEVRDIDGRQNEARLRLGGAVELVMDRHWNVWGTLEGILAGDDRDVLGDVFGFGAEDTELYVRFGVTHKF